jgi:hypothetical protein
MSILPWWDSVYCSESEFDSQWLNASMLRPLWIWTPKQASAVLWLLRVYFVRCISAIPTWRIDIIKKQSNLPSTWRFIYRYLLTFSTWSLGCNFIPMYYKLGLYRSQQEFFSLDVQSCTFTPQFYTVDTSITPSTSLFLEPSLNQVVERKESKIIL